ncbi:MAG: pyridoxal phosphate-dependent aminotransferase [Erysipelotrichaceae bacterium]|nr:pyridoxal phosphate-dependent aminotransferase [Erysipelotrichaceae bacterium]
MEFRNEDIDLSVLKQRAFNYRWAEVPEGVLPLTAADPDFKPAPEISEALKKYIDGGYFSYTPARGFDSFKKSIARAMKERKGENIDPAEVLPVDSAARGMFITAEAILKPGDEAIVFDPVDFLFKASVDHAGATAVRYPTHVENGYIDLSDIEDYVTEHTKMICFCNPHNPLGMCYRKDQLEHLLDVANRHGLYIMNDEIWSDIVYADAQYISLLNLGNEKNTRTVTVYGFSKSFGIAGLRVGCIYTVNNPELFAKLVDASTVDTTAGGVSSLSQVAGQACLDSCFYWTDSFVKYLQQNRDTIVDYVNSTGVLSARKPQATYVVFVNIEKTGLTSQQFVDFMRDHAKLALVAGGEKFFGPRSNGYIRICYATSHEMVAEGLKRLDSGLKELMRDRK